MTKVKKLIAVACVAATILTISGCDNTKDISMNVKKGDKYVSSLTENESTSMSVNGENVNTKQKLDTSYDVKVTDVDKNNNVTMEYKYADIKIEQESNGQTVSYDTKKLNASSGGEAQIYKDLIGKSFSVKFTNKGKVLSIKGIGEILDSIADKAVTDDSQKQKVKDILSKNFGDDTIKSSLQQSMGFYPKDKINVGDTWENKFKYNIILPVSVSSKYKLSSVQNNQYVIDVNSKLATDSGSKDGEIDGIKAKVKLNGNINGNININKDDCILGDGKLTETLKGTIYVPASDNVPTDLKFPVTMKININYKTIKK
ncbi:MULTISPECIES: DUF6263 family protein [Clostridium]|uniref:DUF6263 family protein n=1 Tax=Clostridium TaxID=1485 RepID=UPI00082427AE|nr:MULTISPECIES: DUF6263 family protein [Clostridium]PJI09025.1 hypothetical protein CUB90_14625 [Clostridium sp. CT7]